MVNPWLTPICDQLKPILGNSIKLANGMALLAPPVNPAVTVTQTTQGQASVPKPGTGKSTNNQVLLAQYVLKTKGLYQGSLDGVLGETTKAAVEEFQKQNKDKGLSASGALDLATKRALGLP
jgi:peptidoglycan hydrolase-like protein with peptidoglycan-binding domain